MLGAIQKCQHQEYTNSTLFQTPSPLPPKVYKSTFWGSKTRVSRNTTFIVQQQKLPFLRSQLCENWYLWLCIMIYRLQLIFHTSKSNLKIYFLYIQRKYVKFRNITFKMLNSPLLLGLETSFKTDRKPSMSTFITHQKHTSDVTPSLPSIRFAHLWKCWQLWMAPYILCQPLIFPKMCLP